MVAPCRMSGNRLLDDLPEEPWQRHAVHLEPLFLPAGRVLVDAGGCIRDVYFPAGAIVTLFTLMSSGQSSELAMVGHEGMTGVAVCLGAERSPHHAAVRNPGRGYRMSARAFRAEFDRGDALTGAVLRYLHRFMGQIAQTSACNRHGALEQRLCRWLLLNFDRVPSGELTMTHEAIARALGVKREGVTEAAGRLRRDGAIDYRRGRMRVVDRAVLEQRACECYRGVRAPIERPLRESPPIGHAIAWRPRDAPVNRHPAQGEQRVA